MEVFKFGGASVKDAEAIINLGEIVRDSDSKKWSLLFLQWGKRPIDSKLL